MAATPGGYDYSFVKEPPDTTICVICQLPSRDPYLSVCCGHVFCKSCLDNIEKAADVVAGNCPMCRSEEFVVFPNKQIDRIVKCLHVHCMNKERGCKWQGELKCISDHLGRSDGCVFEDVQCSNYCGQIVQRQYLVGHMEGECPRRMVTCHYCGDNGEYQLIEGEHKEVCPEFPLPCPNKCDVGSVPRQDMTEHRKMCPLEEVECSNKCGKILQRHYLDNHLETKCPRRIVNCQYCQLTGEHQFIKGQHKEQCPKFPLPCPNNCDGELKVSRKDMDTHRKECPLETVQCQYQCVGCDDVMVRKHQREHNQENMEVHLALAVAELRATKKELVSVKTAKTQLAEVVYDLRKELTTTKHRSSVAYAEVLITKCRLPCDELTKMLTSLQANIDNVNRMYKDVENLKDKGKHAEEIASVDEFISRCIGELRQAIPNLLDITLKKATMKSQIEKKIYLSKRSIENSQSKMLAKVTQLEKDVTGIYQQLDDVEVTAGPHRAAINELLPQVDNLIKDLTTYNENDLIEKLNTVKTDMMKLEILQLAQKRKHVDNIKKLLEMAKSHIPTTTKDLLHKLSNKHDKANQALEQIR